MFLSTPSEQLAVSEEDEPVDYMPGEEGVEGTVDFYYNPTDEPGFLSPVLYNWAGRPDLSNDRVRSIIAEQYGTGRDGLPGNDDSGAISSWLLFHMMILSRCRTRLVRNCSPSLAGGHDKLREWAAVRH
jgi:hypothetical protein